MKINLLALVLALAALADLQGQIMPHNFFYRQNWQIINPAASDRWVYWPNRRHQPWIVSGGHRHQWLGAGFETSSLPSTSTISVEWSANDNRNFDPGPIKIGGVILHDRVDAIQTSTFLFNYARKIDMELGNYLYLGVNAGASVYGVKTDRLQNYQPNDPVVANWLTNPSRIYPEVSFGAFWRQERAYYFGASLPNLVTLWFGKNADGEKPVLAPGRDPLANLYLTGGFYAAPTGDDEVLLIETSTWLRLARKLRYQTFGPNSKNPVSLDANVRALFNDTFWLGIGYGTHQHANFEVALDKKIRRGMNMQDENVDRIRIGLNYSFPLGWATVPFGHSVELTVGYGFWGR